MFFLDLIEFVGGVERTARAVDQQVDPAPGLNDLVHPRFDLGPIRDVDLDPHGVGMILSSDRLHGGGDRLVVDIDDDDPRPLPGAGMGDREPHPLSGARDEGHPVLESFH